MTEDARILVLPERVPVTELDDRESLLLERIRRLEKINAALMDRVERSTDVHGNAYSLFQTAINLELQVRARTEELTQVLRRLEQSNDDLRRAKEEAEQANAYKTRFLAAAGHDLLQPLNAARLTISALADTQESEEGIRLVGRVDRALGTIEELLKTLLDISKLDAGVWAPDVSTVALADAFAGLASDFGPIVAQKGIALRIRPTDRHVRTDPLLLRRILQNLISNAVRYTPSGGVLIGCRPRGDGMVAVVVADTGIGIPASDNQAIFEEFHRGSRVPDGSAGLGLGLAIVRRMVQTLGHRIDFRSTVGRGTLFTLTLPLADAPATPPPPSTREAMKTFGVADATVLVVENDDATREAMERLLVRWSCRAVTARSLSDVEAAFDRPATDGSARLDLILADYHLDNGETGLAAIKALRRRFGRPIPAVVITANLSEPVANQVRAAGCELMQKPVKPAELRALMAHLLG